jgi:hypothetical protein
VLRSVTHTQTWDAENRLESVTVDGRATYGSSTTPTATA